MRTPPIALALLLALPTAIACGARTPLHGEGDGAAPDEFTPPDVVEDAPPDVPIDVPIDVPRDVPRDVPVDVPRDVPRDVPPDSPVRLDVTCPATILATQTETARFAATAVSSHGLPLRHEWTIVRQPMDTMARLASVTTLDTAMTFDVGGEWLYRYTATDSLGTSESCTVRAEVQPAIELLCPNDRSDYQGAVIPLDSVARSRLDRPLTFRWETETRPPASTSAVTPPNVLSPRFTLDALGDWRLRLTATDSAGLTASCRVNLHADPDVQAICPADQVSRPFATINLDGMGRSRLGRPLTYHWDVVTNPVTSTATIPSPDAARTPFTFDVAGNWTWRLTVRNDLGGMASCTTRARSASTEAVRVELVWNIDRSCRSCNAQGGGIDLDLHMTDVARSMGHWGGGAPDRTDCFYANCQCGSPGMLCMRPDHPDWPPAGPTNNPQLDIDHISDLPGPENINVPMATVPGVFDVGVHYFGGSESTPAVVRIYCGGTLQFESEPVLMTRGSGGGMGGGNNLWRVGRVSVTPEGCRFERCGRPGMLTECIRPQGDW